MVYSSILITSMSLVVHVPVVSASFAANVMGVVSQGKKNIALLLLNTQSDFRFRAKRI